MVSYMLALDGTRYSFFARPRDAWDGSEDVPLGATVTEFIEHLPDLLG